MPVLHILPSAEPVQLHLQISAVQYCSPNSTLLEHMNLLIINMVIVYIGYHLNVCCLAQSDGEQPNIVQ